MQLVYRTLQRTGHAEEALLVTTGKPRRAKQLKCRESTRALRGQWSSHIDREARPDVCAVLSVIAHATRNSIAHTVRIANAHGVLTGREMKGGGQGIAKARPGTVLRGRQKGTQEHR